MRTALAKIAVNAKAPDLTATFSQSDGQSQGLYQGAGHLFVY